LNFLAAAIAAGKKRQKHVWASMLNLQSHPVWARINGLPMQSPIPVGWETDLHGFNLG
jgi:hypothetical protein